MQFFKKFLKEFWHFGCKQAYASIFWGFLLVAMLISHYYYPFLDSLFRYDFLFFIAVIFQIFLIIFKFETPKEVGIILIFHIIATIMEIFKTHPSIGSWSYPENFTIGIFGIPLFVGFMYSAVGSYIGRIWRIFDFHFRSYPPQKFIFPLTIAIYINFFTHHFIWDFRYILTIIIIFLFYKTRIFYKPHEKFRSMSLLLGLFLVAFFIWIAENIATYANIWIYPNQATEWNLVGIEKILSWFLLIILSFSLISLIHKPRNFDK